MITCTKCKSEFEIPEASGGRAAELTCPHCHSRFRVKWKMEVEETFEEPAGEMAAEAVKNTQATGIKVLVAIDGEATQDVMREILNGEGYEVLLASTGQEALSILENEHPTVAYLDVALPQVLGFEVCEIIKKSTQLKETKVILVSAIYDKTRYKRAPTSLYGADDYIERHHIQDGLIKKLKKILNPGELSADASLIQSSGSSVEVMDRESLSPRHGVREAGSPPKPLKPAIPDSPLSPAEIQAGEPAPGAPDHSISEEISVPPIKDMTPEDPEPGREFLIEEVMASVSTPEVSSEVEIREIQPVSQEAAPVYSPEESAKHEEAKRFARLIISDIALYNQKVIEEGIENGNIEELLKDEMAEAEKLFQERVSKELREKNHYLQDALRDLVDRKLKMMNQGK